MKNLIIFFQMLNVYMHQNTCSEYQNPIWEHRDFVEELIVKNAVNYSLSQTV